MGKAKRSTFKTKTVPSSKGRLHLLHMNLCGPIRVESINGKKYILSGKGHFTNKGTEFLNNTLQTYFKEEGISHQTTIARTPIQNDVVERRNSTLVEVARTMLSASKLPLLFWAEAIPTAYNNNESSSSKLVPNVVTTADKTDTSLQELELLFSPMYEEYFNAGNESVSKSSALSDNLQQNDTQPTLNVQPTIKLTIPPIDVNVEENNNDQAKDAEFEVYEFINPFAPPGTEVIHRSDHHWTKDHPLEQVRGNPSKPVQRRRQLATDPKMCMSILTMSNAEPKNIKEVMADHALIEAMQEELHQFNRLNMWELVGKPFEKTVITKVVMEEQER
ncbi:retrovirus-related pol polyprotein from transposon TNT 1-94 [Tanacetum coccineum]